MNRQIKLTDDLAYFCLFDAGKVNHLLTLVRTAELHIGGNGPGLYFAFDEDVYLLSSEQPSSANGQYQDWVGDEAGLSWQEAEAIVGPAYFSIFIPLDVLDMVLPESGLLCFTRLPTGEVLIVPSEAAVPDNKPVAGRKFALTSL